ncbi:MAG: anhydro-N-acetylmuramic acid kinase [Deltaproteobacteria bacterium RIFCSPHIGHO2_02_FULL_40_11]|nr:MAG: anhydro-N-acetylmuramic acid kinase [Deltaproteobacteria bacterium RIFCSPHIGHO2_02_FULL_40_11]
MANKLHIIGLMSGTSVDGIDAALVEIRNQKELSLTLKAFEIFKFPKTLRQEILKAMHAKQISYQDLCGLNVKLSTCFAEAAQKLCQKAKISLKQVHLIGSHGQTIQHLPSEHATLQLGDGSTIAVQTGVTTVSDFRMADMAAQGQGAPLAPLLHFHLFKKLKQNISVLNIGGMSNLTVIPKTQKREDVYAFDTGPGNVLIDAIVQEHTHGKKHYDAGGALSKKGKIQHKLLDRWMRDPYFRKSPPKSTGREKFGLPLAKKILQQCKKLSFQDMLATVTALTAYSIADAYERFVFPKHALSEIIVGGGGAKNKMLFSLLQRLLPQVQLKRFEDYHLNSDAIEAIAFAHLAYETWLGNPGNLPKVTGATRPVVLGKISPVLR